MATQFDHLGHPPMARSVTQCIMPIEGELESGIEPLVLAMRQHGFSTISCCEGHFRPIDYRTARPNVVFAALDRGLLHGWIRETARTSSPLPVEFCMFPVWDPDRDVVHEDNWMVWIDVSQCETPEGAAQRTVEAVLHLRYTLQCAARNRPLATDTFVRSRW
jgi:hypothetical protein